MFMKNPAKTALQQISRFRDDKSGNIATITAATFLPFMVLIGGSIDMLRVSNARTDLQNAIDSAVLAAASLTNTSSVEDVIEEYMDANTSPDASWDEITYQFNVSDVSEYVRDIEVVANTKVKSTFLGILGIEESDVSVVGRAKQAATNFEISMVLDISSSMRGSRLTKLKQASKDFVDQVIDEDSELDQVSINLIPYGGTVNIGPLFDTYVSTIPDSIMNPSQGQYNGGTKPLDGKFRFSDGLSCIESRFEDFNDESIPENSRAQVPHFTVWNNNNPWCPWSSSEIFLNTSDVDELHTRIDNMTLSDGTGSDIGLLWGVKALSPHWRGKIGGDFASRPADYDDPVTTKIMVLMTDGGITWQGRPKESSVGLEKHATNKVQKIVKTGNYNNTSSSNTGYGQMKRLCEELEANGVKVFTIGFQIGATSSAAKQMEDCAVNGGAYYLVDSLDIGSAFEAISAAISNLRITG